MYRLIVNILLVLCFALPSLAEDVLLRIDSTFYYEGVPKEDLAEVVETWLDNKSGMASAYAIKSRNADLIVFYGIPDSFKSFVEFKNIFLAVASDWLHYSFQIAVRDGVVRVWFTDFAFAQNGRTNVFRLYEQRPKDLKFIYRPLYSRVYKFALKTYPERIASLHVALDEEFKEPEPLWPIFYR